MRKHDKLTRTVFKEAKRLYWNEGYDQKDIGEVLKCDQTTVSRMINDLFISIEDRRAAKKAKYVSAFKAPKFESKRATTIRCMRRQLPCTKLTMEKVNEIRRAYFAGDNNQVELAELYGVNQSMISKIITGINWKICKC